MEGVAKGSITTFLSAFLIGLIFGYISQRGRFCMNRTFRHIIYMQNLTLLRAYLLSLIIAIPGANLLEDLSLIITVDSATGEVLKEGLTRQVFTPAANIIGGYIFGIGTVLVGRCVGGTLYRIGEGFMGAWMAFLGMFLGISLTTNGLLKPIYDFLKGFEFEIGGNNNPALWDIFSGSTEAKWITICILVMIFGIFVLYEKPFRKASMAKGYPWATTGLLIGLLIVIAWWASAYWGGMPRGISFIGPTKELFFGLLIGDVKSYAPVFDFFGLFKGTWASIYVIAVPLGSFLSARSLKEFNLVHIRGEDLLRLFLGGIVMGIGGAIAGGCNIGHGLTGMSTLAISSIVTTIFIILGNWTMVYFKFIRGGE